MNEFLFVFQVFLVILLAFGARKLGKEALITFTALMAVMANLFVLKQMLLFGWNVTCSDVFAVGSILSLNLLQEHFGKETAKKSVWICFGAMLFFALMSQIHLFFAPSPYDSSHPHFTAILSPAPRLLGASLLSFFLVQQVDVAFFGLLKKTSLKWRWRNLMALFVSQLLDTVLFSFLGLYGIVASLASIILVSFAVKLAIVFGISLRHNEV